MNPMQQAIQEAKKAKQRNDFPIGATLTHNNTTIATQGNRCKTSNDWQSHAEHKLLTDNSSLIKHLKNKHPNKKLHLHTTLEPCLMCLATAAHHRIDTITYTLPDPQAGAAHITINKQWYQKHWPKLKYKPTHAKQSLQLLIQHAKQNKHHRLKIYQQLKANL